uniref:Sigma factor n=1 Tax=Kalanchoe fedtschenkoi TaxID=63787 RepID=A0A7N0RJC9_KALFE
MKASTSSSAFQTAESRYSQFGETKVLYGEDESRLIRSFQLCSASHYHLLLENLSILEETFTASQAIRLETDILVLLGRLGALKLFRICLSRTFNGSASLELGDVLLGDTEGQKNESPVSDDARNVIVRSGKKEERKSRRKGSLEKLNKNAILSLPVEYTPKKVGRPVISSSRKQINFKMKRSSLIKNEADIARGVKVVANLESIKASLDKDLGRAATLGSWAKAAGIDEKQLQQQLRFGWYCRDELLRSTRPLIVYIARTYRVVGVTFDDLIQAGNVGVLRGTERFDHTRGYKFSTYIQYWIRKYMSALISRHVRGILIPTSISRATSQILKARAALKKCDRVHPTDEEIAEFTGLSLKKIQSARQCARVVGSIDKKMGENLNVKFLEYTRDPSIESPEEVLMQQHMRKDICELLNGLDSRERQVLALRYGLGDHRGKSLQEIGNIFGVSREWIRKVERRAFKKLRNEKRNKFLNYYLDLS